MGGRGVGGLALTVHVLVGRNTPTETGRKQALLLARGRLLEKKGNGVVKDLQR